MSNELQPRRPFPSTTCCVAVSSPGGLPKGLTLAHLGHRSIRRNALVADLLHRIGFVEKARTGIRRIRDEASKMNCPEPEFGADRFMTVTFRPNPEVRPEVGDLLVGGVVPEVTPEDRRTRHRAPQERDRRNTTMSRKEVRQALDEGRA